MHLSSRVKQTLGVLFFSVGLLLGIAFTAAAVWGDLEAALFDPSASGEETLRSLACPVLITRGERGVITASFTNTGARPVERAVRLHVSEGHVTLMREENMHVPIAPGESQRLSWTVDAGDAAYGFLILVRVSTLRQSPMPAQTGACGILVLDLPLMGGTFVVILWLALSLLGMLGGGRLWLAGGSSSVDRARSVIYLMLALGGAVTVGMIFGLLGLWVVGVLLLALIVLLLIAVLAQVMLAGQS